MPQIKKKHIIKSFFLGSALFLIDHITIIKHFGFQEIIMAAHSRKTLSVQHISRGCAC